MKQKIKAFLGIFSLLSLWSLLLYQLATVWQTNDQYAHGFLVPFLCLFLLIKVQPEDIDIKKFSDSQKNLLCYLLGIPLVLSLFPLWLIREANSDWRLINLVLYGSVLILSLLLFSFIQNKDYDLRKFLFPLLFFIVAIPWPLATDLKLTQWLQEKISTMIVDCLLLLEHEAILEGTVIDVGIFGKVGVDQACSGINGLQASLVVSLFLGSYYSFSLIHRFLLVLGGLLIALFFNLARAFCLSFVKVKGKGQYIDNSLFSIGDFSIPNLHDLVGFIETSLIFIFILLIARLSKGGLFLTTLGTSKSNWGNLYVCPPLPFSIMTIISVISTVVGTEFHFMSKEKNMLTQPKLDLALDNSDIVLKENFISRNIDSQLHYEEAKSYQWQDRFRAKWNPYGFFEINHNDEYWQAFIAHWDLGGACEAVLSTHSPASCLPLTGLTQITPPVGQDPILLPLKVDNIEILFEAYEFSKYQSKLFVFRCFWPHKIAEGKPNLFPQGGYNFDGRIQSAIEGRRNVGGTMLALSIANIDSMESAVNKLEILAQQRLNLLQQN
ncbi:MAG: exosortase/archaeosortase family protein [Verrucomicrobiota bacterium]|nr:exosortase/archaeosortase family protein [Verrucomicrobiota bacterium]